MAGRRGVVQVDDRGGTPSVASCWRMASTAGVPSVTTSTLRFTPPCGPTGGAVLSGVGGGVIFTVGGVIFTVGGP